MVSHLGLALNPWPNCSQKLGIFFFPSTLFDSNWPHAPLLKQLQWQLLKHRLIAGRSSQVVAQVSSPLPEWNEAAAKFGLHSNCCWKWLIRMERNPPRVDRHTSGRTVLAMVQCLFFSQSDDPLKCHYSLRNDQAAQPSQADEGKELAFEKFGRFQLHSALPSPSYISAKRGPTMTLNWPQTLRNIDICSDHCCKHSVLRMQRERRRPWMTTLPQCACSTWLGCHRSWWTHTQWTQDSCCFCIGKFKGIKG